jgi:endonuclease YncB( thermonuclease family)
MDTPMPGLPNHTHRAAYLGNHDGDTVTLLVELDFGQRAEINVRVLGINAPELATPEGKVAQAWAQTWFGAAGPSRWPYLIASYKPLAPIDPDKYGGRWDAYIWRTIDSTEFGAAMIAAGMAAIWDGHGPRPVPTPAGATA